MYCPRCSQEQVDEQMRFCSRCGFPLTIVSQLITEGGKLPGFDAEGNRQLTPRQKGGRLGGLLLTISLVLTPIVALMTAMKSDLAVLFLPVIILFILGLARLLYALLLQENVSRPKENLLVGTPPIRAGLPEHERLPLSNWRSPVDTSEMGQPASVTENTTKILIQAESNNDE